MTVLLPSSVAGANLPLLLSLAPAAFVYALAHPKWRRLRSLELLAAGPSRRAHLLWAGLFAFSLLFVLGVTLERYHADDCPNSALLQAEIELLARWSYDFTSRQQVPYWVAFGNILFVLRGNDRIPVGDTDSDIAIEKTKFLSQFGTIEEFTRRAKMDAAMEIQREVHVVYHVERELIQIFLDEGRSGSHADIWLYKTEGFDETTGTPKYLVNDDRTIRAKKIPYNQVMPVRENERHFLGTTVSLPRNPQYLAEAEYGSSFMTPLITRLECMENFWNGYAFYKLPPFLRKFIGLVLFTSSTLTLLLAYLIPSVRDVVFQKTATGKAKKKFKLSRPSQSSPREPSDVAVEMQTFLDKDHV